MKKWSFYTAREIKPSGWIKDQLLIQARGLGGNLDRIWPDVRSSKWIGGDREGWERVPYWLDGFIPLAYLLDDQDMIRCAKRYIDAILSGQHPDGWICPCSEEEISSYDTWATQLISKVLVVYYECSGDERIPDVLYRTLRNYHELLSSGRIRLFDWGRYRWYETFIAINFLYERYHEEWIVELARILKAQGMDYRNVTEDWKRPLNRWRFDTHIVNLTMMLKSEALSHSILGEEYTDLAEHFHSLLYEYNGTPVGLFTGDECLSGLSPIQGTELCAVAEQMYSYEWLYAVTGDSKWAERLERIAFNALPATFSDDMWAHQYVQMSNQIACMKFGGRSLFRTNNDEAHLFGLEPHFGCCTANFNQAWPKFTLSAFMHNRDSIISAVPIPSTLSSEEANITLDTDYPFRNVLRYHIEAKRDLVFRIRIPSFAEYLTVNGSPVNKEQELSFRYRSGEKADLTVSFNVSACIIERPYGLRTVEYGPLVFSIPVRYRKIMHEYVRDGVERRFPYCDYEYAPESKWSYAFSSEELSVTEHSIDRIPFSSERPAVTISAKMVPVDWGLEDGFDSVCAKLPVSSAATGPEENITLYPYGCTKLRMTEIPLIHSHIS